MQSRQQALEALCPNIYTVVPAMNLLHNLASLTSRLTCQWIVMSLHSAFMLHWNVASSDFQAAGCNQSTVHILGQKVLSACCLLCITSLWEVWAHQHAQYTWFLPQTSQEEKECTTTYISEANSLLSYKNIRWIKVTQIEFSNFWFAFPSQI